MTTVRALLDEDNQFNRSLDNGHLNKYIVEGYEIWAVNKHHAEMILEEAKRYAQPFIGRRREKPLQS